MYYFLDQPQPQNTLNINCEVFRHDGSAPLGAHQKIAFHHHHHEAFEILAVKKGELQVSLDGRKYDLKEGDVVVVNPLCIHFGVWNPNGRQNEYVCITFSLGKWLGFQKSILFQEKNRIKEREFCFDEFYTREDDPDICASIESIADTFPKKDAVSECRLASSVYRLMADLFCKHYHSAEEEKVGSGEIAFRLKVSRYLFSHYAESISTADIAGELYMSVPTFCYQFKKNYGTTFLHYLVQYRITRATELYREKPMSLQELSAAVGFYDYCYFSRLFRKYMGESPSVYFKK